MHLTSFLLDYLSTVQNRHQKYCHFYYNYPKCTVCSSIHFFALSLSQSLIPGTPNLHSSYAQYKRRQLISIEDSCGCVNQHMGNISVDKSSCPESCYHVQKLFGMSLSKTLLSISSNLNKYVIMEKKSIISNR